MEGSPVVTTPGHRASSGEYFVSHVDGARLADDEEALRSRWRCDLGGPRSGEQEQQSDEMSVRVAQAQLNGAIARYRCIIGAARSWFLVVQATISYLVPTLPQGEQRPNLSSCLLASVSGRKVPDNFVSKLCC